MFENFQEEYVSSSQSSCPSLSDSSGNGSFYSWDTDSITPPLSTRQDSSGSMKLEDTAFPCDIPEGYVNMNNMSSISSAALETMFGFPENNMLLPERKMMQDPSMAEFNSFPNFSNADFWSFHSSHGLPVQAPALELDLSSPVSMNFVVPSQTTFNNTFDMQSPIRLLHFNSPASDYNSNLSPDHSPLDNMTYLKYEDYKSSPMTPSRLSTTAYRAPNFRQALCGPASTSAALHGAVQSEPNRVRRKQKRMTRLPACGLKISCDTTIGRERAAEKRCLWPQCGKKFKRQEHLKRHEKTHLNLEDVKCEICGHVFKGSRPDNLSAHLDRHKTGSKRTHKDERADCLLEDMARNKKKKKKRSKSEGEVGFRDELKMEEIPTKQRSRLVR